jgi:hypothetical protein
MQSGCDRFHYADDGTINYTYCIIVLILDTNLMVRATEYPQNYYYWHAAWRRGWSGLWWRYC